MGTFQISLHVMMQIWRKERICANNPLKREPRGWAGAGAGALMASLISNTILGQQRYLVISMLHVYF